MLSVLLIVTIQASMSQAGDTRPWVWEGHVHDASTGAPLPGVHCTLWTEDMYGAPRLVVEGTTDHGGGFELGDEGRLGQKLVLRRQGYRSTEVGSPPDRIALLPLQEPLVFRVLDLEGRPIQGAVLQTRQSCRHAIPAVRVISDAGGVALIPDPPPLEDGGDLEVLAPGFGALGKLSTPAAWNTPALYLPRRLPVHLRLLDDRGRPIPAGRVRYQGESGGYRLEPDEGGWVSVDPIFDDRRGVLCWRQGERQTPVHELRAVPGQGSWTLRFGSREQSERDATLEVKSEPLVEGLPRQRIRLIHDEGWLLYGAGVHELPPGGLRLIVGEPFSGVREVITRLELAVGEERRVVVRPEPEPLLRIRLPEVAWGVHVQAGDDSVSLRRSRKEDMETHVPPGVPVTVLTQGGSTRRVLLQPWSGVAIVDLRGEETLLQPARPARTVELRFLVQTVLGEVPEARALLRAPGGPHADLDPAPDGVMFRVPEGARWEARFSVDGRRSLYRSGTAGSDTGAVEAVVLRF